MSTAQKRGADYDNQLANEIHDVTPADVHAISARGSGNIRTPQPDLLVTTGDANYAIEAKRSSIDTGDRTTVLDESQRDDISQLCACSNSHTRAFVAIKLTRRRLCVVKVGWTGAVEEATESIVSRLPDAFDANHTSAGNVTIRKPDTDDWPSASQSPDDVVVLAERLGLPIEDNE